MFFRRHHRAIVGPTQKGPAFTPTIINSFSEFEEIFGSLDSRFYVPYTAKQYLKSAGTVTIVRVLAIGGYQANTGWINVSGSTANTAESYSHSKILSVLAATRHSISVTEISSSMKTIENVTGSLVLVVSSSAGNLEKTISKLEKMASLTNMLPRNK